MKRLFILFIFSIGAASSSYSQEIIPFPDLSESHIAVYNQTEVFDDHNYTLYTEDYQIALRKLDNDLSQLDERIQTETDDILKSSLEAEKVILNKKRTKLLEEAELIDDLNKFY
ncbi:hypothetical protein QWY87_05210 [Lutimonas halocynthiae]|uniref:hypothetical protein n=1 Tax=Lutimonas halocynthiae TaxID=1446477 RepID=UPI0025B3FD1B|nr:hypothetical protein [Lutimonas halocynthiae]MDN3642088.1 hypothetical protein [Lutimonas halocynthiae]